MDQLHASLLKLSELITVINIYCIPLLLNHQKAYGFLLISGGIEANYTLFL